MNPQCSVRRRGQVSRQFGCCECENWWNWMHCRPISRHRASYSPPEPYGDATMRQIIWVILILLLVPGSKLNRVLSTLSIMAVISMLHFAACSSGGDSGGGGSPPPPTAATSWNFEAGTFPPDPNVEPNAIPTVINLEGAPHLHYARLTASPSDCGEAFFTTCPRTRAEKYIGGFPLPDTTGQIVTFQFDIRIPSVNNSSAADNLI